MKLGFVSAILHDLTLEEVLEFASAEGFSCLEVMCWPPGKAERKYAGITHIDVTTFDKQRAAEILQLCEKYGVEISALGYYPNPLEPDPDKSSLAVNHIKAVIRAAPLLSLKNVNTFIGRDWTKNID